MTNLLTKANSFCLTEFNTSQSQRQLACTQALYPECSLNCREVIYLDFIQHFPFACKNIYIYEKYTQFLHSAKQNYTKQDLAMHIVTYNIIARPFLKKSPALLPPCKQFSTQKSCLSAMS